MYGFAEPMNFQPKFDSGVPVDGDLPAPKPERKSEDRRTSQAHGLFARLSLIGFITALASRATDPVIPPIAHDIRVDPNAVALLTTAFALPFALVQPVLGPVGDMVGKVRVMIACLAVCSSPCSRAGSPPTSPCCWSRASSPASRAAAFSRSASR